ncbi:hypothetical protein D9756_002862 [Leucocoprinus leucothites]|uniref:DRBM domain-containing protein n=1 Tax=Leucocoprinus leucothites TaxID=201217 RepID=A0A8H5G6D5_9AGAR|nr:hypothetical protein D9756_002862 [Leucoagaricus leucothites]
MSEYRNKLNTVCSRKRWPFRKGDCVSSGPQQSQTWTCDVFVNGNPFTGSGPSKDKAYEEAAKTALENIRNEDPDAVPDGFL